MKKLLYFILFAALAQNFTAQAAEKKHTKKKSAQKELAAETYKRYSKEFYAANIDKIKECLAENPEILGMQSTEGFTLLLTLLAGTGSHEKKVAAAEIILNHPGCTQEVINHKNIHGVNALFYLLSLPNTVNLFEIAARKGADFSVKNLTDINLLMIAIARNNQEAIDYLSNKFPQMLTEKDSQDLFPLHEAIKQVSQDPEVKNLSDNIFNMIIERTKAQFSPQAFNLFLNGSEEDNGTVKNITTPFLERAIRMNNAHCIASLLSHGADPNHYSADKLTPLGLIADYGTKETFDLFITMETIIPLDLTKRIGENEFLPFLIFSLKGKPEEALMIAQRMNPDDFTIRTKDGTENLFGLLEYVLKYPAKYNEYKQLLDFIIDKNPESVNQLSPNSFQQMTVSPLILAASRGNIKIMQYLLEKGADPYYVDQPENTGSFLSYACLKIDTESEGDFIEFLEYLEKKGLQELFFKQGFLHEHSLLITAMQKSNKKIMAWLIKKGALKKQRNINLLYFLVKTTDKKQSILTEEMLKNILKVLEEDPETKFSLLNDPIGSYAESLLHRLVVFEKNIFKDKEQCLKLLLAQPELDINAQRTDSLTPLMVLLSKLIEQPKFDCIDTLKILLTHPNIDLSLISLDGRTVLHMAAQTNQFEVFQLIKKACQQKCPEIFAYKDKAGFTYQDYINKATTIKNSLDLLAKERKEKRQKAQEFAEGFLNKIEKNIEEEEAKTEKEIIVKEKSLAAASSEQPEEQKIQFNYSYTTTLKMWQRIAEIIATKPIPVAQAALEKLLERDGYFSNPAIETDPIRKTRATVYQNLNKKLSGAYPTEDKEVIHELAALKIAKEHGFPDFIIKTIINNHPALQRNAKEETEFEITVIAQYQDAEGIHSGTYEIFGKNSPRNMIKIHHALFRESPLTAPTKAKKIPAATAESSKTSASKAAASGDDAFELVGKFKSKTTELDDKTIHTITDNTTGTVYTLEIPK